MAPLTVTLPGLPPSVNHRHQRGARGRVILSPETRAWQTGATLAIRAACAVAGWAVPPKTPLHVTVRFTSGRLYGYDLDNALKSLGDSIAAGVGVDDRYITVWYVVKQRGKVAETHIAIQIAEG